MSRIITVYNRKGGVAKTLTSFALAWHHASHGNRVLAIDLDSQANLTSLLKQNAVHLGRKIADIIVSGEAIKPSDVSTRVIDGDGHRVDFIPASVSLSRLEAKLPDGVLKEFFICDLISEIAEEYDRIIIDTPPSAEVQSIAALVAATDVLIPTTASQFGIDGVRQTVPLVKKIQSNSRLNPNLNTLGLLVTRFPTHKVKAAEDAFSILKDEFADIIINKPIREGSKVEKALEVGTPITAYDPTYYVSQDYTAVFNSLFNGLF